MKPWIEKAKAANGKALDAVELFSIAGQKWGRAKENHRGGFQEIPTSVDRIDGRI